MYKEIQYIRAVAVLMVVWGHAIFPMQAVSGSLTRLFPELAAHAVGFGDYFGPIARVGVDIFFVISGYVVSSTLFRSLQIDEKSSFIPNLENNVNRLKAFFVRRFYRLFPVAFLMVLIDTLVSYSSKNPASNITEQIMGLLSHITMQSDMDTIAFSKIGQQFRPMNHYWSLAVEERFYLIIPFVILWLKSSSRIMSAAMAVIVGLAVVKAFPLENPTIYLNGFLRFDSFMFGILVYLLQSHTSVFQKLFTSDYSKILMNFTSILIFVILARTPIAQVNPAIPGGIIEYTEKYYYYIVVYTLSAILITLSIQDKGYVLTIPGTQRILAWIGDRSYIIYVFQFQFFGLTRLIADHFQIGNDRNAILTLILLLVIAICSELIARTCEIPLRRYGQSLSARMIDSNAAVGLRDNCHST